MEARHCIMMMKPTRVQEANKKPLLGEFKYQGESKEQGNRKHTTRKTPLHKDGARSHLCLSQMVWRHEELSLGPWPKLVFEAQVPSQMANVKEFINLCIMEGGRVH